MRSRVQPFPVELKDPYGDARASMFRQREPAPAAIWLATLAAMALGCGIGWHLLKSEAALRGSPAVTGTASPAENAAPAATDGPSSAFLGSIEPGNPVTGAPADLRPRPASFSMMPVSMMPASGGGAAENGKAWPVILQRAGDGRFHADLAIDGAIITVPVDPATPRTRLRRADLPAAVTAGPDTGRLVAGLVALEHARLPAGSLPVDDDGAGESIIGADLLHGHFTVEESRERLRLAPLAR